MFQYVGKHDNIEQLQSLQNCRREWLLMNLQAARASDRRPGRIWFDPGDFGAASVRDDARHRARATAYIQHPRSHWYQLCQHACNLLRRVHVAVVAQRVKRLVFVAPEYLVRGIHFAISVMLR